jgi:uncharacterized phage-associated protein
MAFRSKKYEQAILYLCSKLGTEVRGKKKLAKLLYFVDFDYFEKNQTYFTGEKYKKLPMGPFPMHMEGVIDKLAKKEVLSVKSIQEYEGYNPTEVYKSLHGPDVSVFTEKEKEILDRVIKKYGHLSGKQLEDITHAEAPYIGTEEGEEIDYELAYYRGTEFVSND